MELNVNGDQKNFAASTLNILNLLKAEEVTSPDMVSVQVNGKIVDRSLYSDTLLKENDEVNFLYFMGGGSRA